MIRCSHKTPSCTWKSIIINDRATSSFFFGSFLKTAVMPDNSLDSPITGSPAAALCLEGRLTRALALFCPILVQCQHSKVWPDCLCTTILRRHRLKQQQRDFWWWFLLPIWWTMLQFLKGCLCWSPRELRGITHRALTEARQLHATSKAGLLTKEIGWLWAMPTKCC